MQIQLRAGNCFWFFYCYCWLDWLICCRCFTGSSIFSKKMLFLASSAPPVLSDFFVHFQCFSKVPYYNTIFHTKRFLFCSHIPYNTILDSIDSTSHLHRDSSKDTSIRYFFTFQLKKSSSTEFFWQFFRYLFNQSLYPTLFYATGYDR